MAVSRLSCALSWGDPNPQAISITLGFGSGSGAWAASAWRLVLSVGPLAFQSGNGKPGARGSKKSHNSDAPAPVSKAHICTRSRNFFITGASLY